jgi:hypothetical protein
MADPDQVGGRPHRAYAIPTAAALAGPVKKTPRNPGRGTRSSSWLDNKHEDRSHDVAAAASHFPPSPSHAPRCVSVDPLGEICFPLLTGAVLTVKTVPEDYGAAATVLLADAPRSSSRGAGGGRRPVRRRHQGDGGRAHRRRQERARGHGPRATSGQHLTVQASGPDAREAVAALIAILSEATKVGG